MVEDAQIPAGSFAGAFAIRGLAQIAFDRQFQKAARLLR
jgi:hypothetical protein